MITAINHVGIAVGDLASAIERYRRLFGRDPDSVEDLPARGVRIAIFRLGLVEIELFEPLGPQGDTVRRFLEKRGEGIHHICLDTVDIEDELRRLEKAGFSPVGPPREGAAGRRIAFLRPVSGVLLELSEQVESDPAVFPADSPDPDRPGIT